LFHVKQNVRVFLAFASAITLSCVLLSGCSFFSDEGRRLAFTSQVRLNSDGKTDIVVLVRNVGDLLYTDEEEIDGRGEVFNEAQQLLARFVQLPVERLAVDEEATIATWQGALEPGAYLMRWTTPRHGGVELEFTLLKRFGVLEVGTVRERQIAPDPAAASASKRL
jgi:hypothetical protein